MQVTIDRDEITETGEYDLDGLFVRLNAAIDAVGAKRVVLDTIEALFAALTNLQILRSELRRLFAWLKEKGVTAIVTGERGDGSLTRHGLEEYVSDCVILLDARVTDQIATRRLRVVKYRGSAHGTNEYPFLIDEQGFTVLPITGIDLQLRGVAADRLHRHSQASTRCSPARAISGAAACWSRASPGPASPASPRTSSTRPAGAASAASISPSRSRPTRSCATCARSASTWAIGSPRACCASPPRARRASGWRYISAR